MSKQPILYTPEKYVELVYGPGPEDVVSLPLTVVLEFACQEELDAYKFSEKVKEWVNGKQVAPHPIVDFATEVWIFIQECKFLYGASPKRLYLPALDLLNLQPSYFTAASAKPPDYLVLFGVPVKPTTGEWGADL